LTQVPPLSGPSGTKYALGGRGEIQAIGKMDALHRVWYQPANQERNESKTSISVMLFMP